MTTGCKKRVLITGLYGFTGRYVAAELERSGYEVYGIDAYAPDDDPHCHRVDLADAEALSRVVAEINPQAVVHLAAIAFVGHDDANAFYNVNLIGTRNLLVALAGTVPQVDCVLLASSANIYGNTGGRPLNEETRPGPTNDYAVSKLTMEYMANLWADKLPIVITRPFNYTGVGQSESFLIPKIVSHFKNKKSLIELGNLDVWREFNDVRSVALAYRKLLESAPAGGVFNISSGRMYSLRDVLVMAQRISGYSLEVRVNPAFVRKNEVERLCGDGSLLKSIIGEWDHCELEDTLGWMLKEDS